LEAERQEKEAEEAGEPEADLMEDGRGELSREHSREQSEGGEKDRTLKERLGDMVPPAAGETCAAVVTDDHRLSFLGGYTRGQ
jgi:hypothetical protein